MNLTPQQKEQIEAAGCTVDEFFARMKHKIFDGRITDIGRDTWLVDDQGWPPIKGETVTVNGRIARVINDRRQLTARGAGKFTVQFIG